MKQIPVIFLTTILLVFPVSDKAWTRPDRPHVILINVDNHGKGDLGYYGNRFIETPHIDRLFHEGLRFENYHCAGRCTSSRSALLTGRYHARNGALGTGGAWGQTREGVPTIAHVFSETGYHTAMFGKWHVGDSYPLFPEDRGFEEVVSVRNGSTLGKVLVKPGSTMKLPCSVMPISRRMSMAF